MPPLTPEQIKKLDETTIEFTRGLIGSSWTQELLDKLSTEEMQKEIEQVHAKHEENWSILANLVVGREVSHID